MGKVMDGLDPKVYFTLEEEFQGEKIEAIYRYARKPVANQEDLDLSQAEDPMARMGQGFCPAFNQRTYEAAPGVTCMQDVEVVLRDGCKIYTDLFLPTSIAQKDQVPTHEKIPCIVSWSWFGKRPGDGMSEWQIMGVPPHTVSKLAKFESSDPAFWCYQGYAVANVDVRGAGHSEGNVHMFTHQDREDGYDFVEWLAQQEWCNGKIGMTGNSGVAMHQWGIAAECPPHLACIAPWESTTDLYSDSLYEGGIPALSFNEFIAAQVTGTGGVDDQVAMARVYPFRNGYWNDKMADFSKVRIPVYQTAGWSHFHLPGSSRAYIRCKSKLKWFRAHRDFEWPDTYDPRNLQDLKLFYDRYLKDIHNGWEMTPKVRIDVMDVMEHDYQERRPENEWPLKRTEWRKYYLDASKMTMQDTPVEIESSVSYNGETAEDGYIDRVEFDMEFKEDTELTGYMWLRLWVSCDGYDDMDMFINIQKADSKGNWLPWTTLNEPHPGQWGKMRVSRRALWPEEMKKYKLKGKEYWPVQANISEEKLKEGEIVPVDIAIVPSSRFWHKGQKLRIQIAGNYIREGWFEPLSWDVDNHGKHIIHTGGQYDSWLQVPYIPPKFETDGHVYR
ncbi:MAG: CocE/NonD family hydrolase [Parasporobacterium sp.]|nr:CocE/NonD family hydrolase [Parasporobacterium sp.]